MADFDDKKVKVMVFGTFDIFHPGHAYFLKEARKLGDFLIAVVALDSTVVKVKHKPTLNNQEKRLGNLLKSGLVDNAVLGNEDDYYKVVEDNMPDVICIGYDQHSFISKGLPDELVARNISAKIVHIAAFKPDEFKSSLIREKMENEKKNN